MHWKKIEQMCLSLSQWANHLQACTVPSVSRSWSELPLSSANVAQVHSSGCGANTSHLTPPPRGGHKWEGERMWSQSNPSLLHGKELQTQGLLTGPRSHSDRQGTTPPNSDGSDPWTLAGRCIEEGNRDFAASPVVKTSPSKAGGAGSIPWG